MNSLIFFQFEIEPVGTHLTVFSLMCGIISDFEQLRALELNSWQLLRLMQAQLPSSLFGSFSCNCFLEGTCEGFGSDISECSGDKEKQLICLFRNAAVLHGIWKSKKLTKFVICMDGFTGDDPLDFELLQN